MTVLASHRTVWSGAFVSLRFGHSTCDRPRVPAVCSQALAPPRASRHSCSSVCLWREQPQQCTIHCLRLQHLVQGVHRVHRCIACVVLSTLRAAIVLIVPLEVTVRWNLMVCWSDMIRRSQLLPSAFRGYMCPLCLRPTDTVRRIQTMCHVGCSAALHWREPRAAAAALTLRCTCCVTQRRARQTEPRRTELHDPIFAMH